VCEAGERGGGREGGREGEEGREETESERKSARKRDRGKADRDQYTYFLVIGTRAPAAVVACLVRTNERTNERANDVRVRVIACDRARARETESEDTMSE
jgi:hypothetical protein